jgi:hypothetical protein
VLYQSRPGKQVLDRIEITVKQPWTKLVLFYSTFVIIVFGCKIGLIFEVWKFSLDFAGPLGVLTTRLVAPFEMPLWQVTSAINAGLTWAFFFRAKRHVLAKGSSEALPEAWVKKEYVGFQAVRTTFSLYAIACTFYIAAATAWQTEWPPVHFILFPRIALSGP